MLLTLANVGVWIIALLHLWFCTLEVFFWQKPLGRKIFKLDKEFAQQSATLAANQGIYNAFLSAGLFWGLLANDTQHALQIKVFFLSCVIIAGIAGGLLVNLKIMFIQAFPALITLLLLLVTQGIW